MADKKKKRSTPEYAKASIELKDTDKKEDTPLIDPDEIDLTKDAKITPIVSTPKPPAVKPRPVLVSFARWFAARSRERGWKAHWAAGMKAFTNTAGRKSMEDWDLLFKKY